jgi:hypothetical protein
MRTTGIFQTRHFTLKNWKYGRTLNLVPFGDIHRDSPSFAEEAWAKSKARWKKLAAEGDALFLGMGDYLDSYSTSERMVICDSRLHESTISNLEKNARDKVGCLSKELTFMRGHLLGVLGGNHYPQFSDGTNGDQLLANNLSTKYLGACCAIRVCFEYHGRRASFDIFAHHGKGGGMTAGGRLNAVEKLEKVCDADIFLMGDNHARGCIPTGERLRLVDTIGGLIVKAKPTWIGRTGSFLRGYVEGQASYVVDAALPPANLGHIEFQITPIRIGSNERGVELQIGALQ